MKEKLLNLMTAEHLDIVLLKEILPWVNTADIAEVISELVQTVPEKEKHVRLFRLLPKNLASDVFSFLDPDEQQQIIEELSDKEIGEIINNLFADDAADFIEEMPANVVKRVLQTATPEKRATINQLLKYPEDSAGSIMTTEFVDLYEEDTVAEAFDQIRKTGVNKETIYICYVIKKDRLLVGTITVKKLLLAQSDQLVGNIMNSQPIFARTSDDQETIADMFRKYGLMTMPVVDKDQRLVGIITVDDIVEVIEEEATEDIEKMHALAPSDDPYLKTGIFQLARNRIVWLLVLMLSATITGTIISGFEDDVIKLFPFLVAFIPMLMGTGGNAGSQASTLIIRGMAVGEIKLNDVFRVLWREIRVASLCGLTLCAVNILRIYIMSDKSTQSIKTAVVVSITLFCTILIAKSIGCLLPMLAKKVKLDPAVMATPLITTIVDATSLIVYFSFAKMFFRI